MTRFDATERRPVDKWTAAPRLTTSPQGQQPQQKRSIHMVHKPVNSECSRHFLSIGMTPEGDFAGGAMTEVIDQSTSKLNDADRRAIAVYIKTLPPVRNQPKK